MDIDRRGATLVVVALLLIPLVVLASLFLDLGRVYAFRSELQLAADAAALAGGSGLIDHDESGGLVTARVHQYVNANTIGGNHANVDSLLIDQASGRVQVVLGYETGPLLLFESGQRLTVRAGAKVSAAGTVAAGEGEAPIKKLQLK